LLRATVDRALLAVPPQRVVVIASRWHEKYIASEFGDSPAVRLLVQPADRGTAAGILYPAHWIRARDPGAILAVLPSDHFVARERVLMGHVVRVAAWARAHPASIVLLGAKATSPETGFGWIEPGKALTAPGLAPIRRIRRFREKPAPREARRLLDRGCLWNTFLMIASASALVEAGRRALPALDEKLAAAVGDPAELADEALEHAFATAPTADFSRSVLAACPDILAVSEIPPVGWSDWGTPERVARTVRDFHLRPAWGARPAISGPSGLPDPASGAPHAAQSPSPA
jgi:mannose-1-phosphate guanylyltransferase